MLKSLEIQNFKGIKQGKLDDLAQVNILVGRNNSGKSTILDALIMLRCGVVLYDFFDVSGLEQIIRRRVDRGSDSLNYHELWFRMNAEVRLKLSADFVAGVKIEEEWDSGGGRNLPKFYLKINNALLQSDFGSSEGASPGDTVSNYRSSYQWQKISSQANGSDANYLAFIHLLDATTIHRPFAERIWHELVKDRRDTKVVRILNEIYRTDIEFLSFMPFPRETRLVAALPRTGVAIDWLGDGFRYAMNILALGVFLKGTALLIEELETHQHPESLRELIQTLFELAREQDLQLFLTTHSMELITYALDAAEEKGIDLKLHHLTLDEEGTLRAIPFTQPNAQLLLDMGHDPRMHYKYIQA